MDGAWFGKTATIDIDISASSAGCFPRSVRDWSTCGYNNSNRYPETGSDSQSKCRDIVNSIQGKYRHTAARSISTAMNAARDTRP